MFTTDSVYHCTLHPFPLMRSAKSCISTSCSRVINFMPRQATPMRHSSLLDLMCAVAILLSSRFACLLHFT